MTKPKIIIKTGSNLDIRGYHTTVEISKYFIHAFKKPFLEKENLDKIKEIGEIGTGLLKEVFAIEGVDEIFIRPYELSVIKTKAFDWKNIQPCIIKAIKKVFGEEEKKEVEIEKISEK